MWRKWSKRARETFTELYRFFRRHPGLWLHPTHPEVLEKEHLWTMAWNAAFLAADAVDEVCREVGKIVGKK